MITDLFLNFVVLILTVVFSLPIFPKVDVLPAINGFDIDTALLTGVGQLHSLFHTFWYLSDMWYAFLFLLFYYGARMAIIAFLGHRSPWR